MISVMSMLLSMEITGRKMGMSKMVRGIVGVVGKNGIVKLFSRNMFIDESFDPSILRHR